MQGDDNRDHRGRGEKIIIIKYFFNLYTNEASHTMSTGEKKFQFKKFCPVEWSIQDLHLGRLFIFP